MSCGRTQDGFRVARVMADSGSAYRFKYLLHTPRTNGKAERFVKTSFHG